MEVLLVLVLGSLNLLLFPALLCEKWANIAWRNRAPVHSEEILRRPRLLFFVADLAIEFDARVRVLTREVD